MEWCMDVRWEGGRGSVGPRFLRENGESDTTGQLQGINHGIPPLLLPVSEYYNPLCCACGRESHSGQILVRGWRKSAGWGRGKSPKPPALPHLENARVSCAAVSTIFLSSSLPLKLIQRYAGTSLNSDLWRMQSFVAELGVLASNARSRVGPSASDDGSRILGVFPRSLPIPPPCKPLPLTDNAVARSLTCYPLSQC